MNSEDLHNQLFATTSRLIENANKAKTKSKGLISNDTQYRLAYAKVLSLFEKADKLAVQRKTDKLKKVEKEIITLSLEVLDYERFRMNNPDS
jgi:hypothetical protein